MGLQRVGSSREPAHLEYRPRALCGVGVVFGVDPNDHALLGERGWGKFSVVLEAKTLDVPAAPNLALRVSLLALSVASALVGVAWVTELRSVFHGGLLALGAFAFLPFVVIATLVGMFVLIALLAGLAGDATPASADGAHIVEGLQYSARGIRAYYTFLNRHRRSVWLLGLPLGAVLGTLVVWALLSILIVPKEVRTTEVLLGSQVAIDAYYRSNGDYPVPADGQTFVSSNGQVIRDGFDRPVRYEVHGKWRLKSYRLHSYGSDGVPSSDDLCVEGRTKLQDTFELSAALIGFAELARFKQGMPVTQRLNTLRAVQCERASLVAAKENQGDARQ